jgi:hypothetical protein
MHAVGAVRNVLRTHMDGCSAHCIGDCTPLVGRDAVSIPYWLEQKMQQLCTLCMLLAR